jgi:ATP-dependent Clp protease ATP-binding subunit ClpX
MFEMEGAELCIEEEALDAIVHLAVQRKTGARGLRSIMEAVLLDTMFELPSDSNIAKVIVTEGTVSKKEPPKKIIEKRKSFDEDVDDYEKTESA